MRRFEDWEYHSDILQCQLKNIQSRDALRPHRTKYPESVNGNVAEICETVAETRRLTRVSAVGLVTFTRVSAAAVTTEPDHFFTCFRQVSVEGNKCFASVISC